MRPEDWKPILIVATSLGFVLTAGGLVGAVLSARRQVIESLTRYSRSLRLSKQEGRERPEPAGRQGRSPHS
jgi:hypothetical protein